MIWKLVTTLLFLFWAVMTGLLVRNTYFAESPALTEVPPRRVFDLFFQQATANVNTLHLYHHQEKLGRATISTVESKNRQTGVLQRRLLIAGTVENPAAGRGSATSVWQLDLDLNHESLPRSLKFEFTATQTKHRFLVAWKEGGEPKVELRQADQLVMDTAGILAMAGGMGLNANSMLAPLLAGHADETGGQSSAVPSLKIAAREGLMDLAGRNRRCYEVKFSLLQEAQITALFSEVGELVRVDLPQGYRLLEPLVHGLEPDLVEHE
ncbi:MAG: hypothetical protein KDK99_14570 [Verrucomicrobiales bacterium]|nr:hypothetical protein [Verrucomicrobiales bacterium]